MKSPKEFAQFAAATVYEAAGKRGDMSPSIRPVSKAVAMCGPAFTVRCWPGDGLAFMRAVEAAAPGDVLVIDGGGTDRSTCWGGSAAIRAMIRGIAGVVTNGAVRDLAAINAAGLPVWAAGVSIRGGLANHPGWHEVPVSVGDLTVEHGDIVLADVDGIMVVPKSEADLILSASKIQHEHEQAADARLRAGGSYQDVLTWYQSISKPSID